MDKRGEHISIPLDEMITSISRIGNRVTELDHDGRWRSNNSLWSELADDLACRLLMKNTIGIRKYIYSTWNRKSSTLRSRFINYELDKKKKTKLQPLSSVSSYQKICTRSKCKASSNTNCGVGEPRKYLVEFSYEEWRCIYKKDNNSHYMDKSWGDAFYDKLVDYKLVTCSLAFNKSTLRKKDSRKYNTSLFQCYGRCSYPECTLTVYMCMAKPIVVGHNVSFWVQIEGTQRHADQSISIGRPMKGIRRKKMAKAAMDHGTLKTYETNVLNADENLLRCNNYTQVPSMDVLKTAVKEQANSMRLDADMFTEIKILLLSMFESDTTSKIENKGNLDLLIYISYVQTLQLWPFASVFYGEAQLSRFIEYCLSVKDSYIYVDATGSVVKALQDQKKPYLYLMCFKDGQDSSNLLPLAGALLTDHTTASIASWLLKVRHSIAVTHGRFLRPSYIVIDFSPALLNALLLSMNQTNIHSYLRWCFNAVKKNYTSEQLHSISCIRFCCAHVMHAFTRSLSKIKIEKKIRQKATVIFGVLLNCNDFEQIYELIGCIVCIFGSSELDNAEEYLDNVIKAGGDFNSDFETFIEDESISDTQRFIEQELSTLDDNFLSTAPILHQSPFTKLACERSPALLTLIDKSKMPNEKDIKNSFFSKELIKVFYKWIAYLPLFTGLMHRFYERYASDLNDDTKSKVFGCGRVSNAPIESFFKIIKHSILRHQTNVRPADFLLKLYSTTSARLKANMHNIQQTGSKRRGRSKKKEVDTTILTEKWKNKGTAISNRGVYFNKFVEPVLTASDIRSRLKEKLEMRKNQPDNYEKNGNRTTTGTTNPTFDDILIENVETQEFFEPSQEELNEQNKSVSSIQHHTTEQNISVNIQSIKPTTLLKKNININESAQTTSTTSNITKQQLPQVEEFDLPIGWPKYTMVGDLRLPFPHFNIGPTWFEGKRYSASNTCALDSSLFLLYYIYMSHLEDFRSLFDPNILICEQLRKTFDLVNAQGWDIARLYWISTHSTHANQNDVSQHHDLYATADNNVFQYVRDLQKHAIKSTCRSKDCPKLEKLNYSVDISMPQLSGRNRSSMKLTNFLTEYITNCGATIGPIEPTSYNGSYSQDDFFPERDGNGTRTMFICESGRVAEPHQFVYKSPPVLLLNVGQIKFDIGKNETIVPTVKHLPFLIIIGKQSYCLAGAMCPKAGHFTATIVREKGRFSKYDDRCKVGVKNNEGGDDFVETAIYAIEMNNS
ncbi:unnamed protein product [Rotaria socialis]|nr:unnamed protein product [Rotaria socialis]